MDTNDSITLGRTKKAYAHAFADRLEEENPKFNRNVFLKACGIEDKQE